MAVATAAGFPQASGVLIPEIWSPRLLVKFYDASTYGEIANTDYEGEIANEGDKVEIRTTPNMIVRNYVKGEDLTYDTPESSVVELLIDKAKYFAFDVDDIDRRQSDIDYVEDWAEDGSESVRIEVDKDINANIFSDANASNSGLTAGKQSLGFNLGVTGTPLALTKANVVDKIIDCGSVLDEQSVPENNRWIILPPVITNLIQKSDLKDASLSGDQTSIARNGRLGVIGGFMIYKSNLLSTASDGGNLAFNMIFGQKHGLTFAAQIAKMEQIRSQNTFGDKVRSLLVYGYKVLKDEAIGHLYGYKA